MSLVIFIIFYPILNCAFSQMVMFIDKWQIIKTGCFIWKLNVKGTQIPKFCIFGMYIDFQF